MNPWICLTIAIISETVATTTLKSCNGFQNLIPSIITIVGYCSAFFFLSLALKTISVGIAYAIWSGIGIALISMFSWILYQQSLDLPAIIGMILIILGVCVITLFSQSTHNNDHNCDPIHKHHDQSTKL